MWIKEKWRLYMRKYRDQHRQRRREIQKKYRDSHKEQITEKQKEYRENNKSIVYGSKHEWYLKHKRFLNKHRTIAIHNTQHNLSIPHFKVEKWKNKDKIRVSRLPNGRFVALELIKE